MGKESACNAGDVGLIPGLGRSPVGGHGNPLQYSCLENPHGQRNLVGYSSWDHKESDTTEWLTYTPSSRKDDSGTMELPPPELPAPCPAASISWDPSVVLAQSYLPLCDHMGCSTSGFPALDYLLEFAQTHVHWVGDIIQPSHSLSPPSPPALNEVLYRD